MFCIVDVDTRGDGDLRRRLVVIDEEEAGAGEVQAVMGARDLEGAGEFARA